MPTRCGSVRCPNVNDEVVAKLQALVYDILPSTTAVFSYAIGSRKLSANEKSFVGAQTVVSLLQTTPIKQGVSFIATNKVYTSTNKTTELFSLPGVDASHVYVRALALGCFYASCFGASLPDLVSPLKGHSLFPRSCPATRSAPSERFGY